ncbi:MAG: SCO family protein [Flavobacteriales bacterium]|nr:MAG: SCO family protein [Flavobacteriales bacterium]
MFKRKSYIGLFIIIIIFSFWFIPRINNRVNDNRVSDSSRTKEISQSSKLSFINLNGESRKVPEFVFQNQDNRYVTNEDFSGKVYVAEFFFTSCPSICIEMNQNMKILDEEFGGRDDFGIASFTIDPVNDTPVVLKKYAERLNVKSQNWHFLTGKIDDVYELSNSGFNIFAGVNPAVAGGFEHQGFFALIDKNGYIRSRKDSNGNPIVYYLGIENPSADKQGIDMIKEDIRKLLKNG